VARHDAPGDERGDKGQKQHCFGSGHNLDRVINLLPSAFAGSAARKMLKIPVSIDMPGRDG
jgi:hypothetical protein